MASCLEGKLERADEAGGISHVVVMAFDVTVVSRLKWLIGRRRCFHNQKFQGCGKGKTCSRYAMRLFSSYLFITSIGYGVELDSSF